MGYTDMQRLAAGELVYTGLVRGFVMATADRAPFNGTWTPLINENFATMADAHRILDDLPAGADQMATADGRDKTLEGLACPPCPYDRSRCRRRRQRELAGAVAVVRRNADAHGRRCRHAREFAVQSCHA